MHSFHIAPKQFRRELDHLVRLARHDVRPLVLLLTIPPFGSSSNYWVPGLEQRRELFNAEMKGLVDDWDDPEIRNFDTERVTEEIGYEIAQPDGHHMSAVAHRRLGELLAAEILDWTKWGVARHA